MGTTAQKLQKLADTKQGLASALTAMGRTPPAKFADYAAQFTAEVNAKQSLLDGIISGTGTLAITSNVTAVREYALYRLATPYTVTLPNATSIGGNAFQGATAANPSGLTAISAPNVTTIGSSAFNRSQLTSVDLPACTTVNASFSNCTSLATVKLNAATSIAKNAFTGCTALADLWITGKTKAQIKAMANYSSWGCPTTCTVHASDGTFTFGS